MQAPLVTIGIPAYRQQQYLAQTVDSCLQQTYVPLQIMVSDDDANEESNKPISTITDERLSIIAQQQQLGRLGNYRELLYNRAAGDWYINLDGDDYLSDENFVQHAMSLILANGGDHIAFFQGNQNLAKLKSILPDYKTLSEDEILVSGISYFKHFPQIQHFQHCAVLMNRKKALPLNFYSFDALFSDFHSVSRLALHGDVILSAKHVAQWRQHEKNASKGLNEENLQKEILGLEDIAHHAAITIGKPAADKWLSEMKEYYRQIFIYHYTHERPGLRTMSYMLKHWGKGIFYPKFFVKNILLMLKLGTK